MYAKISDNFDTIKSNEMSFDESRVYYNTNASKENTVYYDTVKPLSKPKYTKKPDVTAVTTADHQLATYENLLTEGDEDYVLPGIIENQFALTHDDQHPTLIASAPPGYQELVGQRLPPSIYEVPTKIPATT